MTQQNLLELAKQGNSKAIETLINRQLQTKGIAAKIALKNDCLQIMLESEQVPDQRDLVAFLRKSMTSLEAKSIKRVKVYGKKTGEQISAWNQEFELTEKPLVNQPVTSSSSAASHSQQTNIKELARQGNVEAITTLLNRVTQLKSITTTSTLNNSCLQVIMESDQVLDEEASIRLIRRELTSLKVEIIKIVKVYGKQTSEELPSWSKEFALVAQTRITSPSVSSLHHNSRIGKSQDITSILTKVLTKKIVLPKILKSSEISIETWKILGFLGFFLIFVISGKPLWLICFLVIIFILDLSNKESKNELEARRQASETQRRVARAKWQAAEAQRQEDILRGSDPLYRLEKLKDLKDKGVITEAEFEAKKRKLLDQL